MPIVFACPCGKQIQARDSLGGRVVDCPACNQPIEVPPKDAVDLGVDTGDAPPSKASAPPQRFVQPVAAGLTPDELVKVIAKAIAIERDDWRERRPRFYGSEIILSLALFVSFFAMINLGAPGGICFVVCLSGLAIVARL